MPRRDSDRNLLFGINALQNDFITRDALIAAMAAWALEKHRSLGDILVERGALNADDRALLDQLLDRHLARHGNDPLASLAAMSSIGSVADDLRRSIADPEVLQSLDTVAPVGTADPFATRATIPPPPPSAGVRFRKVREHAAGNLGVVYVARDEELNREVALKEIKERNADHAQHQAKFLLEAEVTGGLEHPGIVPVYGLGHHDDGRPYYAMRFIRGKSLLDAIKRFHADESLKSDPGRRTLALQKLLRRFTDVCNAVAYAHSRGILHRDLKPDNVMVGKYGETLVVDWGLAKALGTSGGPGTIDDPDDPLPEASLQPSSADGLEATQAGSLVGTPAYMSPEQAAGRLDLLGPASDVYGLGATLYHLLVGRPPIQGANLGDVLAKVRSGEISRPRTLAPWLDPALEAICLKAMALNPEARYATPRALAEDLDRWIAGEPVVAYPEPFARRARRWAGKHRTGLTAAASVAAVTAILLGGFAWQRISQRQRADASARTWLDQAQGSTVKALLSGDPAKWSLAVAETERALDQLKAGGGSSSLRRETETRLAALEADRGAVTALDEARLRSTNAKDGYFDMDAKHDAYLAAFRAYGIDLVALPVEDVAKQVRSSRIAADLISALDDWARYDPKNVPGSRLEALARAAESDSERAATRDLVARRDAAGLRRLCEKQEERRKLGFRLRYVFDSLLKLDPAASFPQLQAILRENPSDFWLNHDLGMAYLHAKPPQAQEAVRLLSVAVALRPDSPGARLNLGNALLDQGRADAAIAEFREAIRLEPDESMAHNNLGAALIDQGEADQAIAELREAIRLEPDRATAHINLGAALKAQGQTEQAVAEFREAVRLKPDHAMAHNNLGAALGGQGKADQAVAELREAIRLEPDYSSAHTNLGNALRVQGKADAAIAECREAVRIRPDYAEAHYNLGVALDDQGKADAAIAEFREAIRLKPDHPKAHYILGIGLLAQGNAEQAVAEFREAVRLKPDHPNAHHLLGIGLQAQGQTEQAVAEFREAVRLKPDYAEAHYNLGVALQAQGQTEQAVAEFREAIRLEPDDVNAHINLGIALGDQGNAEQAVAEFREAVRLKPDYAEARNNLGIALQAQGRLDEAVATYREAIRLKPDNAEAHCNLGLALGRQGLFRDSLKSLERGHELGSRRPGWTKRSESWVSNARRLSNLEASLASILKGEVRPTDVANRLELADVCYKKGLPSASARFWDEAFAERPELADDLARSHRYNAACAAALAGTGSGKDDPSPDEATRLGFREKARGWLRADLAAWAKVLDGKDEPARKEVAPTLAHWKADSDLAGIRDKAALNKLPEAEREAFRSLWADVEALKKKAEAGAG